MHRYVAAFVVGGLTVAGSVSGAARPDSDAGRKERIEFTDEVQNLRFARRNLFPAESPEPRSGCPTLDGDLRSGKIPHREAGESAISSDHFIPFVVAYPTGDAAPRLLVDLDLDGIDCDDEVPLLAHPRVAGSLFRTLHVTWKQDGAPARSRRYRLTVPARADAEPPEYRLELVDVPVARRSSGGTTTLLVLYDGNHDGTFARAAGDGLLVSVGKQGPIDIAIAGENFRSYHGPLDLPNGHFEIRDVDPRGRFIDLVPTSQPSLSALDIGDRLPAVECTVHGKGTVTLGGARQGHQLVYFWMSACGGCDNDMSDLIPLLQEVPAGRLDAVGVSLDDDPDSFRTFVDSHGPGWPQCYSGLMQWDDPLSRRLDVKLPSTYVLLDPEGRLLARGNGVGGVRSLLEEHGVLPKKTSDSSLGKNARDGD